MSAIKYSLPAPTPAVTQALAAALARQCRTGDCITLTGDLGAGKTTFARGFISALYNGTEEIVSPTFTLVQTYPARDTTIWHFDLYRLKSPAELDEIGLDEALQTGITLIEWPQLAQGRLPRDTLDISITPGETPDSRIITFSANAAWQERLPSPLEGEGWVGGASTRSASGATPPPTPLPQGEGEL